MKEWSRSQRGWAAASWGSRQAGIKPAARWRPGRLQVHVAARFPLAEGAAAHAFLESRRSSGKVLLIP